MTTVPSTRQRAGPRPLEGAIARVEALRVNHKRVLTNGPTPVQRLAPADDNFVVTTNVSGGSILLLDDTFTTGTSAQAAASALQLAGATVRGIVVAGRFMNPDFSHETQDLWDSVERMPFDFDSCCIH
jgi:adenine/guanine phosphoribosyltransferase-like PRPP-binding protein